jgi:L-ascorbate metabolism protein UlaG (beta-lactamase superfamily)
LETVRHIKSGDVQGWFAAWERTAARVEAQAAKIADPISKGRASVEELDWWESRTVNGLALTCLPAQHFSGRTLWDQNRRLWSSGPA